MAGAKGHQRYVKRDSTAKNKAAASKKRRKKKAVKHTAKGKSTSKKRKKAMAAPEAAPVAVSKQETQSGSGSDESKPLPIGGDAAAGMDFAPDHDDNFEEVGEPDMHEEPFEEDDEADNEGYF